MSAARFKLDSQGIDISGSEVFVESQLDKYNDLIRLTYEKILSNQLPPPPSTSNLPIRQISAQVEQHRRSEDAEFIELKNSSIKYENVFVVENGKVQIIADVPGNSTVGIMLKVILIYLWAKLDQGIESVYGSELREVCQHYGHYDGKNFIKYIDQHKKLFFTSGEGKSRIVKLIRPGIKEAEKLITELNQIN